MAVVFDFSQSLFSIVSWISWHEYVILGKVMTLIYNQKSRKYYLLYEDSSRAWHDLVSNNFSNEKKISALEMLLAEGVIECKSNVKYVTVDGFSSKIECYEKIPESLLKEIREEGYIFDAHWDITNRCNERCIHCYNVNAHNNLRNNIANELSYEESIKMVDDLYYLGVFRLVLSGGEVLTNKFFLPLCKYIRKRNMQLIVYTNGLAFTDSLLEEFVRLYPSVVCLSVYGDSANVHDGITRIRGSYKKVLKSLAFLKSHQIETHYKNTLLTKNYECWHNTFLMGKKLAQKSMINCTIYPSQDSKKLSVYSLKESQLMELALDKNSPIYYGKEIKGSCNILKSSDETPCYNITNTIYIKPNGEVCLCIAFPCGIASLRENNVRFLKRNRRLPLFNCDFSHLGYLERLDNWRSLRISSLKECGSYEYCKFCIDVCPGDAFLLTGDLLRAPENHCIIAKARYKAFLLEVESNKNDCMFGLAYKTRCKANS